MSGEMQPLVKGRLYLAGRRFVRPGLYVWTGRANRLVLPLPRWAFR